MRSLLGLLLLPTLVGCVTTPTNNESSSTIQGTMSQQVAVGDARQRAKAHVELGMEYLMTQRPSVALDEARSAIEADSSYALGHNLLGLIQMYLKDDRGAEESFQRALKLAPGDPEVNNNYGWFLCQTEREQQSIPYFAAAASVQLYATPSKPLTNAGICSLAIQDDKGAESFLLRAVRADASNVDAQFLLADICYRSGRLEEARLRLNEIHRRGEPTPQTAWLGLRVARKLGDREAENRYASDIRRNFQGTVQYRKLMQGEFE